MSGDLEGQIRQIEKKVSATFLGWSPKMAVSTYQGGYWGECQLIEGQDLKLNVGSTAIQFGQSAVEGCRVYRKPTGERLLFRINRHYDRLVSSCQRLCMPFPDFETFFAAINKVISDDAQWRQPMYSNSLYIRPMVFGGSSEILPVPAKEYYFVVLVAPFRTAYKNDGLHVLVEQQRGRTAKGGLGGSKTASNYAHLLQTNLHAKQQGYDSVLWLDASTHSFVESCNVTNIFFELEGKLITPALNDTIIAGITRQSVIDLAQQDFHLTVEEREITINEMIDWHKCDSLKSIFVTATAAGIQPVSLLEIGDYQMTFNDLSPIIRELRTRLICIQQGKTHDNYTWVTSMGI